MLPTAATLPLKFAYGLLLCLPCAVLLILAARFGRWRVASRPHPSAGLSIGGELLSAVLPATIGATAFQATCIALIGTSLESIPRITTIYPGSAIFYLVPQAVIERAPLEVSRFLFGGSALISSLLLFLPYFFILRRSRSPSQGRGTQA